MRNEKESVFSHSTLTFAGCGFWKKGVDADLSFFSADWGFLNCLRVDCGFYDLNLSTRKYLNNDLQHCLFVCLFDQGVALQ